MASRDQLTQLRELVKKRQTAANKKVSRLRNVVGVDIAGTKHDVRRDAKVIGRYNTAQLKAYVAKLDSFVSRETQYVPGAKGTPLPVHGQYGTKRFNELQSRINKAKKQGLNSIKDIVIPSQGMSVGERVEMATPKHPVMAAPASYPPHIPFIKAVGGITNQKSLKTLIKDLEGKQGDAYFKQKYKSQHTAARKMIKDIANKDLLRDFKSLTPKEFSLLWNYTNFAEVTSTDYVIRKSMHHEKKELAWYDVSLDTQLREARKRIGEVKALKLGS